MVAAGSSIIEAPSKAELLEVWHKRHPWKSAAESEEAFDAFWQCGQIDVSRDHNGWKVNITNPKMRQ
jgi:hypothetical protein